MMASVAMVLVAKGTLLLLVALLVALVLPRPAAGLRHAVWTLAMVTLLLLPVATLLPGPRVALPSLPVATGLLAVTETAAAGGQRTGNAGNAGNVGNVGGAGAWGGSPSSLETNPGSPPVAGRTAQGTTRQAAAPNIGVWSGVSVLLPLWGAGVLAVLLWLAFGRTALRRVLRGAEPLAGAGWDEPLRDAAWLLEAGDRVRLFASGAVRTPMTWGLLRPVVVLPAEAETWTDDRRRAVLLHEMAHVVRRDCLTQTMAGVACALWWFHPLAWYAARRMRVERERACDDMVLAAGTAPAEYASHLLELARRCRGREPAPMLSLHMARPTQLEGRLLAVLAGPTGRGVPDRRGVALATAGALALTGLVGSLQPVAGDGVAVRMQAESPAPAPDEPESAVTRTAANSAADAGAATDGAADVDADPDAATDRTADRDASGVPGATGSGAVADRQDLLLATVPAIATAAVVDTPPARAGTVRLDGRDSIARIVPRVPLAAARYAITSTDGKSALLLQDTTILLQLTDRGLETITRDIDDDDPDRGFLSALLGSMLRGGLRVLLDRSVEYSLRDLSEARYENGRLVLRSVRGNEVFENVNLGGEQLMESFSARDAREFARRVNAARSRLR